jgi:hypothetical protein
VRFFLFHEMGWQSDGDGRALPVAALHSDVAAVQVGDLEAHG